ncbi:MAG: ACT domain-containing protein [Candidatus Aminicenantes bacterium]|nr:MAG: ACT domain-containing protein [Candidatus Aminicenantes bacterium]
MGEKMEKITEIFVVLENHPSTLGELCSHLSEHRINIEAIGVFQDTAKLYVKNVNKAMKVLDKLDYTTEQRNVLKVDLENRPGALADVASKLGNKGINIEYCYGALSKKGNTTAVILDVSDIDRALEILK